LPEEQPAPARFLKRPEGSIFGGWFKYEGLIGESEHEVRYTVTESGDPPAPCVRLCSNPDCRTVHIPAGPEEEKFCTYCGKPLAQELPLLLLREADSDYFAGQEQLINLHLVHPHVHPPISTFQEELSDGTRFCLVTPFSQELPTSPEINEVMEWGRQLASGLDYLHSHGVALGEELNTSAIGIMDGKVVWRDLNHARTLPMLADREKINNVRMLALTLYAWITGRDSYSPEPSLNPRLSHLFQQALIGEGFTSGMQLAEQIELALQGGISLFNLDYNVGRRTHPGQVRTVNEDSMLSFVISRAQEGSSQLLSLFAIADGMGGHATGDLASSLAIQVLTQKASAELLTLQHSSPAECTAWINQAVQEANQAVYTSRQEANTDMGSTLDCALLVGNQAYLAHLGDSRIYLLRAGAFRQLTTDHSVVQQLVEIGKISSDEARLHPQRNIIYRSLGEKPQAEADILTQELLAGDKLLLCSDGLNGMLDDRKIQIICHEAPSPQVACDYLVDAANLAGGEDNISIVFIEVISA